jgi:hypothetical protein
MGEDVNMWANGISDYHNYMALERMQHLGAE